MSNKDNVSVWAPIDSIPYKILDLDEIRYNRGTLTIVLNDYPDESKGYEFVFKNMARASSYQCTALALNCDFYDKYAYFKEQCGINEAWKDYSLFQLDHSSYLKEYKKLSYGALEKQYNLKHYVFVTCDFIIDVIAHDEPICREVTLEVY